MDRNQLTTTYRRDLLNPEGSVSVSDLRSHVIEKRGKKYVSWVLYAKFRIHCLVKHFAFLKNVCYQY